jgi:hypothetical protein
MEMFLIRALILLKSRVVSGECAKSKLHDFSTAMNKTSLSTFSGAYVVDCHIDAVDVP